MTEIKQLSFIKWFNNISISKKLYFTIGVMAFFIVIELGALVFTMNTLSSVRAYVAGEGLWSKAQKDANLEILKYSRSHDIKDYEKFHEILKVPLGDHETLVELSKEDWSIEKAKAGFLKGRNHPDDVEGMIKLFKRFYFISYISKVINIWIEADHLLLTQFIPIGEQIHQEIISENPSQEKINALIVQLEPIKDKLAVLEDNFSYTLGEGSRWLENLLSRLLLTIVLTVELCGLTLAIMVSKSIQKGLNEILMAAKEISKKNYKVQAQIFSKDEIGILASTFNTMALELYHNILEVEKAEKRFRSLLDSAPDAMVIVNKEGDIQLVNEQVKNIFGYVKEELIGRNADILIPERLRKKQDSHQNIFFVNPNLRPMGIDFPLWGQRKSGEEFPIEVSSSPLETEEGILLSAVIRDITDRKEAEEALIRSKQLELKNKELEQFSFVAAHDLQEPMNTLISFIGLLKDENVYPDDSEANQYMDICLKASFRMQNLINSLLDYSRLGRNKMLAKVDCQKEFSELTTELSALIKESKAKIYTTDMPIIWGCRSEIKQLFQNLLTNAIKFCKPGIDPIVKISIAKEEEHWRFTFEDNGIGIRKQDFEKAFKIFTQLNVRDEYSGQGVGLAICKRIVELHHGKIWLESTPDEGSKFHFTLKAN